MGGTADKLPENCGYGFPTIPGGLGPGRRGLKTPYDGIGAELSGEAKVTVPTYVVREGNREGVTGYPPPNPERRGERRGGADGQQWIRRRGDGPRMFMITFPEKSVPRPFLVEGCIGWASTRASMHVHFWNRNVWGTMVILDEVNFPHPR